MITLRRTLGCSIASQIFMQYWFLLMLAIKNHELIRSLPLLQATAVPESEEDLFGFSSAGDS